VTGALTDPFDDCHMVAGGVLAFLVVWGTLFPLQRHTLHPLRYTPPRLPTWPVAPWSIPVGRAVSVGVASR
jgi:hypothetical protein